MTGPTPSFSEEQPADRLFLGPLAEMAAGVGGALEHVVEAYRSGKGVPYQARCQVLAIDNPLFRFYRLG